MAKDDDDDDSLPPLAEKTKDFLDSAKKGKPRSFLLVCKGIKVTYLAVKKKPAKKSDLSEAKKLGYKGDGYFGVITGSGKDLVFNLSMADGYTTEPVKDKTLKDFLEEHAELKSTPTIKIVAALPEIPFDEEDLAHPLIARFIAMGEQISNVLDVRPDAETELTQTVSEIRLLLQDADFKTAEPRINALAVRLQELLNGGQTPATPAANPATPTANPASPTPTPLESSQPSQAVDNDALKNKLQEALNKLVPQLKQAVATYPDRRVELLTPVAQIKKQMDAGELQEAKNGILAVGQLLKSVMAKGATQSESHPQAQPENDFRAEYERKLAELQPSYDRALKDMLGDTGKFRAVMAYITEQAGAGVYATAIKAIDRLKIALEQAIAASVDGAATSPAEGEDLKYLKAKAKFAAARSTWIRIREQAVHTIEEIRDAMVVEWKDETEMAQNLANAVKELNAAGEQFNDDLKLKFEQFIADPPPPLESRDAIQRDALNLIEGYCSELESKPIYDILDLREYSDGMVKSPLLQALAGMAKDLA